MPVYNPPDIDIHVGPEPFHAATSAVVLSANQALFQAFRVRRPVTVSTVYFRVGTQSGNICYGIYDDAGNRIATTGSFAAPASGAATRSQALLASVTLFPGRLYWGGYAADNGTVAVSGQTTTFGPIDGATDKRVGSATTSFPLPATITYSTLTENGNRANYYFS